MNAIRTYLDSKSSQESHQETTLENNSFDNLLKKVCCLKFPVICFFKIYGTLIIEDLHSLEEGINNYEKYLEENNLLLTEEQTEKMYEGYDPFDH
jgi:hypothetical protein